MKIMGGYEGYQGKYYECYEGYGGKMVVEVMKIMGL